MIDTFSKTNKQSIVSDSIEKLWLICRYTRGSRRDGSPGPIMIRLVLKEDSGVEWEPIYLEGFPKSEIIFATAAGILNGDVNTCAVLFLFDCQFGTTVFYPTWMMMVFTRKGIGPVAVASLESCFNLNKEGPEITGDLHSKKNVDILESYLHSLKEEISEDCSNLPLRGFSISQGSFRLDENLSPEYFCSLLNQTDSTDWN